MTRIRFAMVSLTLLLAGCSAAPQDVHIQDIHGMALDPKDPARLYVATHHGLFLGQDDARWSAVTAKPFDMMGFTMDPTDAKTMYASGHPSNAREGWAVGVVKSTDGGQSWTALSLKGQVDFHAMAMQPASEGPDTIYGFYGGKFFASTDDGYTWTSSPVAFEIASLAVDPRDGTVYAATDKGLKRTGPLATGGWVDVAPGESFSVATSGAQAALVFAYFADGLKSSTDGGTNWMALNWTVPDRDYPWAIAPHPTDPEIVYAGTLRGRIFKTTDGGATWSAIR